MRRTAILVLLATALCACTAGRIALSGAQAALEPLQFYVVGDDNKPATATGTFGANMRYVAGYGLVNLKMVAGVLQEDGTVLPFWEFELREYSGPIAFELVFSPVESDPWAQIIPADYERARMSLRMLPPLPEPTDPEVASAARRGIAPRASERIPLPLPATGS